MTTPAWVNDPVMKSKVDNTQLYSWLKDFPQDTPETQVGKPNSKMFYAITWGAFAASFAFGYWYRVSGLREVLDYSSLSSPLQCI